MQSKVEVVRVDVIYWEINQKFSPILWVPTNNYVFFRHQYITGDSHYMYCDNSAKD
jgi:hypothetical protein